MNGCPSEFVLDDRLIHGRAAPEAEAHIGGCPSCQARIAERGVEAAEFAGLAAPTWRRVVAEAAARRRRRRAVFPLAFLGVAGAAAGLVLVARTARDAAVTPKGSALAEIVCRRGAQTFRLGPGEAVAPGDALRFVPLPIWSEARYIQVGSVDGTGAYAPFYPPADGGLSVALPAPGLPLEGSIRLDDAPGPERLLVVLSTAPLAARDVARAALAHAATVDRIDQIGGAKVVSAWIVLPKRAAGGSSAP